MRYFVSYRVMKDGGYGFGRGIFTTTNPISAVEDIDMLEKVIEDERELTAMVLFFTEVPETYPEE